MAGSTITFTPSSANAKGSYIEGKIVWTSELNASTNASRVTARLYIKKNNPTTTLTDPTSGTWSYTFTLNDYTTSKTVTKSVGTTWLEITSLTMTAVKHNADGSKNIKIAGSITAPSGTSYSGLTTSGSKTVPLDLNQHPTKIDSLTCNTKYVDDTISVKYTPQTNKYCHKCIVYVNVGGSLTHISTEELDPTAVTQQTHPLKFDDGELTKVYENVTNTATAKIRVILQTYSDSTYSKKVGDDQYKEISLELPEEIAPTADIEVTPVNSNSWLAEQDIYVAGLSGARVTVTATPGTRATIDLNSIAYNGATYNGGAVNTYARDVPTFKKAGEIEFAAVVMDSRSRYVTVKEKINVLPYSAPTIASVQFERGTLKDGWTAEEEGKDVQVTFRSNLALSEKGNTYNVTFKVDGSNIQHEGETHSFESGTDYTVYLYNIDGEISHNFTMTVTDKAGGTRTATLTIPTINITIEFNESGKGIAFGKTSEIDGAFECAWPAHFSNFAYTHNFRVPLCQWGYVTITPSAANTPTSKVVKFPQEFPGNPAVMVTPQTTLPGTKVLGVSSSNRSEKEATVWITRSDADATNVFWLAVY